MLGISVVNYKTYVEEEKYIWISWVGCTSVLKKKNTKLRVIFV